MGTPRELLTETGEVVRAQKLSVWGKAEQYRFGGPGAANDDTAPHCPWRFAGQYADEESRLHYNRFRYYDAETGQYVSPDPIGLRGGINSYAYVPNPLRYIDPLGLSDNPLIGLELGKMTPQQIADILSKSDNITYKGGSPDGRFAQWRYTDTGQTAVRIDPPDKVTTYSHIHLYDNNGNPLDINGNIVDERSVDTHIKIGCEKK
ncbi:RHS repeat-associated core domain-containing protein [Citrobacter werkmanii]|nr:RHS repeat-associated core domain-containing protein [Citrobacter werkmanii]MDN8550239.1 RHS repeat-associated core domain-containing protein [Citrobacter werkmanii]